MTSKVLTKLAAASAMTLGMLAAGAAQAATYELQFTGTDVSGDVFATTTGTGGVQTVVGVSGWVMDSEVAAGTFAITGLSSYAGASNLFYQASPFVDFGGLSFSTVSGGAYNLGLGGSNATGLVLNAANLNAGGYPGIAGSTNITMTATAVPEPAPLMLMLAGIVGLFGLTRRRTAA
jgi:hypothetical protein